MLKQRKVPMRMCVGCRQMMPKRSLLRVVRSPDGVVSFDPVGKAPGRGAYVCGNIPCLEKALKSRALQRQLACDIAPEVIDRLRQQHEALGKDASGG